VDLAGKAETHFDWETVMYTFTQKIALGLVAIAFALTAHAATVVFNLDQISTTTIAPLNTILGTVTLTENGANQVDFSVALSPNTSFVDTGGPHTAFTFNVDSSAGPFSIINIPTGFTDAGASPQDTPYGTFTAGLDCPGCGPGASNAIHGPLNFSVYAASGLGLSDFIANSIGYLFSADVIGPLGGTGAIAAVSPVPEPETYAMLLAGLGFIGFTVLRRKVQSNTINFA
jgi:PEP-CTERM motif